MKKIMSKKLLRGCILSLLTAGVVSAGSVACAEVIDMTSSANMGGVEITNPVNDVEDSYMYSWDKSTKTLIGGTITTKANSKNKYFNMHLQLKESDFTGLGSTDIKEAAEALAKKIINQLPKDRYRVTPVVEIISADGTVLRKYEVYANTVNWDYANQQYPADSIGQLGDLSAALYRTTLEADATDSEYNLDANNKLYMVFGDGYVIKPDHSKKRKDHIYTGIRGGEKDLLLSHKRESSTSNNKLKIISDTESNTDRFAETYGIYHDGKGNITIESTQTDIIVNGDVSKGIVAKNKFEKGNSCLFLGGRDGQYKILATSAEDEDAVGIEAGRHGVIQFKDVGVKADIDVNKGLGLYAHDGGQILWAAEAGKANLKTNGFGTAVLAETGGVIKTKLGNVEGDIKTDDDAKSLVTANVWGTFDGNAIGNVNLDVNGKWNGNFESTKALTIGGAGVWNGSSAKDKISSLRMAPGALWNVPQNLAKLPTVGKLTGSKSLVKRSYINMGQADLEIDTLSGQFTFNYQHEEDAPANILGGEVRIKKAEPLVLAEEGIGGGSEAHTEYGTVDSTITVSTPAEGINISDAELVDKVLEHLANKAYYLAFPIGENKLKGTVEIQEGLTSASVAKSLSAIEWDKTTGQGHKGTLTQYPFSAVIFGNPDYDKTYEKNITNVDGNLKYSFDSDTAIVNKMTKDPRNFGWGGLYVATINNFGDDKYGSGWGAGSSKSKGGPSYTVDMKGHDLYIETNISPVAGTTGSQPMWTSAGIGAYREGTITFDNPGSISLLTDINYYYGSGIRVSTAQPTDKGAHVVINNDNKPEHAV